MTDEHPTSDRPEDRFSDRPGDRDADEAPRPPAWDAPTPASATPAEPTAAAPDDATEPPGPPPPPPPGPTGPTGPTGQAGPTGWTAGPAGAGPYGPGPYPPPGAEAPPPITAFAWRHGLVRPRNGRLLAGVCAGFGRATNTDPILWRVVLAVLTVFGGLGLFAYLLGWLLMPAEADTATPVEALVGRGRSSTSAVLTVIGGVILLMSFGIALSEPFRPGLIGALLLGGVVLLLLRDQRGKVRAAGAAPAVAPMWSTSTTPTAGAAAPPSPATPGTEAPTAGGPPFAPYGPFAPPAGATYPGGLPPQPPPGGWVPGMPPPRPPRAPRPPRSRLGLLVLSVALMVVGVLALVRMAGYHVPAGGYAAAALATVGLGLILGAWIGRARWLIAIGILLAISVAVSVGVDRAGDRNWFNRTPVTWTPAYIGEVQDNYRHEFGDATLDLTQVDFATAKGPVYVDVDVDVGSLTIIVPPRVDVYVDANVDVGSARVLGDSWGGFDSSERTVTDLDTDGPGGGELHIRAQVDLGDLEVQR